MHYDQEVVLCHAMTTPAHLICIQLDKYVWHALVALGIVLADSVHCVRHILQNKVQICLIFLLQRTSNRDTDQEEQFRNLALLAVRTVCE